MNKDKYVAMDVHQASVVVGVRDASGKYIMESIVESINKVGGLSAAREVPLMYPMPLG